MSGISLAVINRKQQLPFINFKMFQPIEYKMWLLIVLSVFIISCALCITEKIGKRRSYPFADSIVYVVGRVFERGVGGAEPRAYSSRAIITLTSLAMLCLMSTYTAVLTANGLLYTSKLPVTGFKDKKIIDPSKGFTFGTIKNSAYTQMFKRSEDPSWNNIYWFMKPYNFVDTNLAIEKLKNGELGAVISDTAILYHYIAKEKDCSIQLAGEPLQDAGFAIALQKNSSLKAYIDTLMLEYLDEGLFIELKKKWLSSKCIERQKNGEAEQIEINLFGGMYIVSSVVLFVAFLIFIREVITGHTRSAYNIN